MGSTAMSVESGLVLLTAFAIGLRK
jgi:hypothetical protein